MYLMSTFQHHLQFEQAIQSLEELGISKSHIKTVFLDKRNKSVYFIDTLTMSDGHSLLDLSFIFGTVCMLLGGIYGFLWLSPILLGLFGLIFGFAFGFSIKLVYLKIYRSMSIKLFSKTKEPEILLILMCPETQIKDAKDILWKYNALSVGESD